MSVEETKQLLEEEHGVVVLQSGIRIFYGFFRQIDQQLLTDEQWLAQERSYYRSHPFSLLGEHSHFLCSFK